MHMNVVKFEASPRLRGKALLMGALLFVVVWLPMAYLLGADRTLIGIEFVGGLLVCGAGVYYLRFRNKPLVYWVQVGGRAYRTYLRSPFLYVAGGVIVTLLVYFIVVLLGTVLFDGFSWAAWKEMAVSSVGIVNLTSFYWVGESFFSFSEYCGRDKK